MSTTGHYGNSTTGSLPARVPSTAGGRGPFFIRALPVPVVLTGTEQSGEESEESKVTRSGPAPERYALVLTPMPGCLSPVRSLRALLKAALRVHGLRCTRCEAVLPVGDSGEVEPVENGYQQPAEGK
jgi:hypothetical protein